MSRVTTQESSPLAARRRGFEHSPNDDCDFVGLPSARSRPIMVQTPTRAYDATQARRRGLRAHNA
jgi:hypothetical protein